MQPRLRQRNKTLRGRGSGVHPDMEILLQIFWSAHVLFDDVGSDCCDMRVMVADPGHGHGLDTHGYVEAYRHNQKFNSWIYESLTLVPYKDDEEQIATRMIQIIAI